jgi:hypothetical protein
LNGSMVGEGGGGLCLVSGGVEYVGDVCRQENVWKWISCAHGNTAHYVRNRSLDQSMKS